MNHLQASNLLTDFVIGALAPSREERVREHVLDCEECRAWVSTYSFFKESLGAESEATPVIHLLSSELSAYAVSEDTLDEVTRERCKLHLESCQECHDEVDLVQVAISEAAEEKGRQAASAPSGVRIGVARLAWAASLFVALGVMLGTYIAFRTPEEYLLSGQDINGAQTVKAKRSIVVDSTEVHAGASVGFESGQSVSFGEGFSIDSDASLYVAIEDGNGS